MSFDDGNYNDRESFPCPCGGDVVFFEDTGLWICQECGCLPGMLEAKP
jgi:ribosomal protein L37AE/L43A